MPRTDIARTAFFRIAAILPVTFMLALGACSSPPPPEPVLGDIRFTDDPPYRMAASGVEFIDQFQPSFQAPEIEGTMTTPPPARAMHNWVRDRIRAVDPASPNRVRVIITDAKMLAIPLAPTVTGFQANFTKQQTMRYDTHVAMTIEIVDGKGLPVRTAQAEAVLSRSIGEDASLNDRDKLLWDLSHDVTANLGQSLTVQIDSAFGPYLR